MHTERQGKPQNQYKSNRVPETSRPSVTYPDVQASAAMPVPILHSKNYSQKMGGLRIHESDTRLPALVKNDVSAVFTDQGHGDLRKMYEDWRAGLDYYKVPRLCRLDSKLPAIPMENSLSKRRLSQHSASSPPSFRNNKGSEIATYNHRNVKISKSDPERRPAIGRYECVAKIGQGSYGNVFKCRDRDTGRVVAIKKFIETEDNPSIKKIAFREIKILKQLRHPNIVALLEVFRRKQKLHLVFEYCSRTLLEEIQNSKTGIPEFDSRRIISQVLQALRIIHRNRFIHRDVKPENILLAGRKTVKLCDFGFARAMNRTATESDQYTDYVATRWYRAPELLVSEPSYGPGIDIWATACVFVECITRHPLLPGATDIDQLYMIRKMFGDPASFLPSIDSNERLRDPPHNGFPFKKFGAISKEGSDTLRLMMQMDPLKRSSAAALLQQRYFGSFGSSASSSTYKVPARIPQQKIVPTAHAIVAPAEVHSLRSKTSSEESLQSAGFQLSANLSPVQENLCSPSLHSSGAFEEPTTFPSLVTAESYLSHKMSGETQKYVPLPHNFPQPPKAAVHMRAFPCLPTLTRTLSKPNMLL